MIRHRSSITSRRGRTAVCRVPVPAAIAAATTLLICAGTAMAVITATGGGIGWAKTSSRWVTRDPSGKAISTSGTGTRTLTGSAAAPSNARSGDASPAPETIVLRLSSSFTPRALCSTWPELVSSPTALEPASARSSSPHQTGQVLRVIVALFGTPAANSGSDSSINSPASSGASHLGDADANVVATPSRDACPGDLARAVTVGNTATFPSDLTPDGTEYPATMNVSDDGLTVTFTLVPKDKTLPATTPTEPSGDPSMATGPTTTPVESQGNSGPTTPPTSPADPPSRTSAATVAGAAKPIARTPNLP